jgi:hypothetical protein
MGFLYMEKHKKLQILAIFVIIAIALVSIGITANETINEKQYQNDQVNSNCQNNDECNRQYCENNNQQCQENSYCTNNGDCSTNYCDNTNRQQKENCRSKSGCGW